MNLDIRKDWMGSHGWNAFGHRADQRLNDGKFSAWSLYLLEGRAKSPLNHFLSWEKNVGHIEQCSLRYHCLNEIRGRLQLEYLWSDYSIYQWASITIYKNKLQENTDLCYKDYCQCVCVVANFLSENNPSVFVNLAIISLYLVFLHMLSGNPTLPGCPRCLSHLDLNN